MKSARSARLQRRHKKPVVASLSLTSLMDIFTILVFFLLVNSSDAQKLPEVDDLLLPTSIADKLPNDAATIQINENTIYVDEIAIATTSQLISHLKENKDDAAKARIFEPLQRVLKDKSQNFIDVEDASGKKIAKPVTIMMDRKLPYQWLNVIMTTCAETDYGRISLATVKSAEGGTE